MVRLCIVVISKTSSQTDHNGLQEKNECILSKNYA